MASRAAVTSFRSHIYGSFPYFVAKFIVFFFGWSVKWWIWGCCRITGGPCWPSWERSGRLQPHPSPRWNHQPYMFLLYHIKRKNYLTKWIQSINSISLIPRIRYMPICLLFKKNAFYNLVDDDTIVYFSTIGTYIDPQIKIRKKHSHTNV